MPWKEDRAAEDPRIATRGHGDKWGDQLVMQSPALAASNPNGGRASAEFVRTPIFKVPVVFVIEWRFAANNNPDAPWSPVNTNTLVGPITVRIQRGIDELGGVDDDLFTGVGLSLPTKVIGHSLSIALATSAGHLASVITINAAVADDVDQVSTRGGIAGALGGYNTANITRVAAAAADTLLLSRNPIRRQFIVHNGSATQNLAVLFSSGVASLAAGAENYSVLLVPGETYESPIGGYMGEVRGIWAAADAGGEALVTEGITP